jgi:hypothetical protein
MPEPIPSSSADDKIAKLIELAREYYPMEEKAAIIKFTELLRVCDIRGSRHAVHPHDGYRVYISRRALKHFVEERKADLKKRHTDEEALQRICDAIESICDVVINFERYELEPDEGKHFYTKDSVMAGIPSLRVLLESDSEDEWTLEICSIHFTKPRSKTKKTTE